MSRGRRDVPPDRITLSRTLSRSFVARVSEFGNQKIRSSESVPECLKLPRSACYRHGHGGCQVFLQDWLDPGEEGLGQLLAAFLGKVH